MGSCTFGAANMAASYNGGGKSDWYLPSYDELDALYLTKATVGGFEAGIYWSSSEIGASYGWMRSFIGSSASSEGKQDTFYVRPIRAF